MKAKFIAAATLLALGSGAAQAAPIAYAATLAPEVAGATGTGSASVIIDPVAQTLAVSFTFSGLSGETSVAHVHCCTAVPGSGTIGVAATPTTFPGFPAGLHAGSYAGMFDTGSPTTWTAAFVTAFGGGTLAGAEQALIAGLNSGSAYLNVHTNLFPAGEIRGFLLRVPEPASLGLVAVGLLGLAAVRRGKRGR
ncbi:CHRD domain-containing protein [Humitalea sp. 24SJ18S-53]|uniref:CHRD domain-containing protein n=1 Tax=Humitalea sp. 24SJ18S-53 TaxID=3422307 RepID=UPI003D6708D1